ncbi:hypothetical protein E4Z66_15275 [Aliishimia ponticola]|uniref:Uncharacterized protein n=1 Tax=Aliishimia ponticola TaxID=2499833 RepID=A0A4S4N7P4_9RHOB|nr:hypothetical protein [Aliishimia ponticola]THH35184.1 hypothetical protein E4Z66_15275 [Aliishimia ponticola]
MLSACGDGLGTQYSSSRAGQAPTSYVPVTPGAVPVTDASAGAVTMAPAPAVLTGPIAVTPGAVPVDPLAAQPPVVEAPGIPAQVAATPLPAAVAPAPAPVTTAAAPVAPLPAAPVKKFAKGPLYDACQTSGRQSAGPELCGCVQWVADQKLTKAQQTRGAKYFKDNHKLQEVRQSNRASDEAFWSAWKDFGTEAGRQCR